MELKDTVDMMLSNSYENRFRAEYYQTKIRYDKLVAMLRKWGKDELEFEPKCNYITLERQCKRMAQYLHILEVRAGREGIDLSTAEEDKCVYCTLLNRYDNPKLNEQIWVHAGDLVFATDFAEEFGFKSGYTYEIINCSYDSIFVTIIILN